MESNNRPVRVSIIVNRLSRPNNLIRQRHEVPDRRSCSNILEVRSTFRCQTPLPELLQLGIRLRHTRVKLLEFLGVLKLGRDGLVDGPHDGIVPERKLFRICAETDHVTGAVVLVNFGGFLGLGRNSQCVGTGTAGVPGDDVILSLDARTNLISQDSQEVEPRPSGSTYKAPT